MRTIAGVVAVGLILNAALVLAAPPDLEPASVTLERLGPAELAQDPPAIQDAEPRFGADVIGIDDVILIGGGLWRLAKGSVATKTPVAASALPKGADWTNTTGWSGLVGEKFRLTAKNRAGLTFVDTTFTVARRYGGSYQGKGKYLTDVKIVDLKPWTWPTVNLSMDCVVDAPVNVGTAKEPVAQIRLNVKASAGSTMSDFQKDWTVTIDVSGDGRLEQSGGDPLGAARERIAGAVDDAVDCWGQGGKGGCAS